ncbi:MAG: glycosyltransferase family 2 protein [Lachnospiraceae bacterium]|nr:glycosyltransferase family 2 protein [Lachnospiraceae bacterium]
MDHVSILLSTYNGEKYIREQIQSLLQQEGVCMNILVRDDGSTDGTKQILQEYKDKGKLDWYGGENLKTAYSFLDLLQRAPESEYYAFCDQDDFWMKDKLKTAVEHLSGYPQEKPALYYGRAKLADKDLHIMGDSRTSSDRMLDLKSAVINSNAVGCTMVFNKALLDILKEKCPSYIAMHDAWVHKVCIVMKGNIFWDEDVPILYRQHQDNLIGGVDSRWRRIKNHYESFKRKECIRSRMICSLVECYGDKMEDQEYKMCKLIADYKKSVLNRIKILLSNEIKTDYFRRNILFKMAILLKIF